MVCGAKLTCPLVLHWTTPSAFSITMSWHGLGRVIQGLSPAGSAKRLHICDTLCPVQLSGAILPGSAFSCTTIYLHAMFKGMWHTCLVSWYHTDGLQHSSYMISDCLNWKHTQKQYFLRLQRHSVRSTGDPRPSGAVCWCQQFASLETRPQQCEQGTVYIVRMPGSYPSSLPIWWYQCTLIGQVTISTTCGNSFA